MGEDRNLFDKWMKEAALVAAREAVRLAPKSTGKLATSIRGWASKTLIIKSRTGGQPQKRFAYGGVITAGSGNTQYGRATSYGMRHQAGREALSNNSTRGYATRTWLESVKGRANAFMIRARENKKPYMVTLLNYRLKQYIEKKGFSTSGLR